MVDGTGGLRRTADISWEGSWPAFPGVAALVALQVLVVLIGGGVLSDLLGESIHVAGGLAWCALAATALAFVLEYHGTERVGRRVALPAFHLLGLLAVALALHGAELTPRQLIALAAPALAGYACNGETLHRHQRLYSGHAGVQRDHCLRARGLDRGEL